MLTITLKKEWLESKREGRTLWLSSIVLLLLACALLSSWISFEQVQTQKKQVVKSERERWLNQGKKGPHAAAHFGVYIIKPDTALSVLDPGLSDYQGSILRLEAHKKNDTLFRSIQDAIQIQRFGELNPAFILQTLIPLLIILLGFHSIAGERESGTLKQLLANGLSPKKFFIAKVLTLTGLGLIFFVPIVIYLILSLFFGSVFSIDRSALFIASYGSYILIWALLTLIISSYARTARSALITLLVIWATSCLLIPKFAISDAAQRYPTESSQAFQSKLESEIYTPERQQAIAKFKQDTLTEYNVDNVDDLPFFWSGAQLQFGEKYSDNVFDRLYNQRKKQLEEQSLHYQSAAIFSPYIALQVISMSAAATDLAHHELFTDAGETHRRLIQATLNGDLKDNGLNNIKQNTSYQGDLHLWEKIPNFTFQYPKITLLSSYYQPALFCLVFWFVVLVLVGHFAIRRIEKEGQ
jgi:ABC-2 type transport system permease protein